MSLRQTAEQIAAILEGITTPRLAKVYAGPREAADLGAFPVGYVALDFDGQHTWSLKASGLARHDYTMAVWVLVGPRSRPLPELYAACELWVEPVATALFADYQLRLESGQPSVLFVGDGGTGVLLTYQIGVLQWGDRELFGLRISLPVSEALSTVTSP